MSGGRWDAVLVRDGDAITFEAYLVPRRAGSICGRYSGWVRFPIVRPLEGSSQIGSPARIRVSGNLALPGWLRSPERQ